MAEARIWKELHNRRFANFKFRRQHPIGPYFVDFVCVEQRLIIELDGGQHSVQVEADKQRTAFLEESGYRIVRFWNNDTLKRTEAVLETIQAYLKGASG